MAVFKQAPLPFVGQKRNFLAQFKQVLAEHIANDGDGWTIVDAFGGSGLLAHTAKQLLPQARVIYNDFDGYVDRLKQIPDTNRLCQIISNILQDEPRDKIIRAEARQKVVQAIQNFDGYIDLRALSTWLAFSGRQYGQLEELFKGTMLSLRAQK